MRFGIQAGKNFNESYKGTEGEEEHEEEEAQQLVSSVFEKKRQHQLKAMDDLGVYTSGEIHLILGPMFAGKTTALIRKMQAEIQMGRFGDFTGFCFGYWGFLFWFLGGVLLCES
jgi:hypothetical protein